MCRWRSNGAGSIGHRRDAQAINMIVDAQRYLVPVDSHRLPEDSTDTLVIGAGVAGLRAAIAAASHGRVMLLAKSSRSQTNTFRAQGGVAVAIGRGDSAARHIADTLTTGAGLCNPDVVRHIVETGPQRLQELIAWGMCVDRDSDDGIALGLEGGHSRRRIVHAHGDATGRALIDCLIGKVRSDPSISVYRSCFVLDLLTPDDPELLGPVLGVIVHDPNQGLRIIRARATVLACGGASMAYEESTNTCGATGDGVAMAYRAGAQLSDMAFIQFHPTTLDLPGSPRHLISEAVRGEGAHLVDWRGRRFMADTHPLAELAPRDVVSRAIVSVQCSGDRGRVFLDARHVRRFAARFPGITAMLARYGLDPTIDLVPITPAAHYLIGGVATDLAGRTTIPGLYAAGEVASTGLHGANRLASNSLLEGLVMGEAAGRSAGEQPRRESEDLRARGGTDIPPQNKSPRNADDSHGRRGESADPNLTLPALRSAMWDHVGIVREEKALAATAARINVWQARLTHRTAKHAPGWQLQNILLVASVIVQAALWRRESRGCHYRSDTLKSDTAFAVHDTWRRSL